MRSTQYLAVLLFVALGLATPAHSNPLLDEYLNSWDYRALSYQRQLDMELPLGKSSFLTTHNSYNSKHYQNLFRYWDPNHINSVAEQLDMGIRALEYDVHYFTNQYGNKDLLLCHGQGPHLGCSQFDRRFDLGLMEIETWIRQPKNQQEVIILYIEEHIDGHYDMAIDSLESTLGDLIYKPEGCQSLPMSLSKADVLRAGKQIILIGGSCADAGWSSYVFNYGYPTDNDTFEPYPNCRTGKYNTDHIQSHLTRLYEDQTRLSNTFSTPPQRITAQLMAEATACGISTLGLDKLAFFDERLTAAIWSWEQNHPIKNETLECAALNNNGRFEDVNCENHYRFACKNNNADEWLITDSSGNWQQGEALCSESFGAEYSFSTPKNGFQHTKLLEARRNSNSSESIWIDYSEAQFAGQWIVDKQAPFTKATTQITNPRQLLNGWGYCLETKSPIPLIGDNLQHNRCDNAPHQQWILDTEGRLHSGADSSLCISLADNSQNKLSIASCSSENAIHWQWGSNNSLRKIESNEAEIEHPTSLKALNVGFGLFKKQTAKISSVNGSKSQQWHWY